MDNNQSIKQKMIWLYNKGFVHIMGSGVVSKIFTFVGNVFVVRILTKAEYGIFGYVDNLMAFVAILNALGVSYGILQFCSESRPESEKYAYYRFGLKFGIIFDVLLSLTTLLLALFAPLKLPAARTSLIIYSLYPIPAFLFQYYCIVLRYKRNNKMYAYLTNIQAGIYAIVEVVASIYFKQNGIIFALYASSMVAGLIGIIVVRNSHEKNHGEIDFSYKLDKYKKIELIKYSAISCANTMISNLLILLDVFLIGVYISNPDTIASYKVASTIPLALIFIPNSLMMFVYPYFAENNRNKEWLKKYSKLLFLASGALNLIITAILVIFAPLIIKLLWGSKYLSSVTMFRILAINYFVSGTFRINIINIMNAIKKVKENLYVSFFTAAANIILDIVLIKNFGAVGAAYATLFVVLFTTALLTPIMVKSINKIQSEE